MAKLRINGDSSGYVDLSAPNASSSRTIDVDQLPELNVANTFSADMSFGDNNKVNLGAGNDLQLYHDGYNNYIKSAASGWLNVPLSGNGMTVADGNFSNIFFKIDSSGRVIKPKQPSFYAYGSPNGSIATSSAYASPTFNQTGHNIGGHFNTSTYRFTAPVAGRYFFHLSVYWNSTNGYSRLRIEKNGGTIDHYNMKPGTGGDHSQQVFGVVQMAVNDYVLGQVQSDQSNSYFRARNHTFFEGYLLG